MNHLKSGNSFFGVSSYKNYKYNEKDLQEIGMYDYRARMYMAVHEVSENALIDRDALNSKSNVTTDRLKSQSPTYRDCCSTDKEAMPQDKMTLMIRTSFESTGMEAQWNYELFTPKGTKATKSYSELIHFKISTKDKRLNR